MRLPLHVQIEPARSGAVHMQRDAALLQAHAADAPPILCLYSWTPPAVSLGHMQEPDDILDRAACDAAGIDIVRRPTGGRAILHWDEITYAVIGSTADRRFGDDLTSTHARIGRCLAAGLRQLGVETTLSRPALDPERRLLRQPCFVSPGRAEILVDGRKLLGSAQRRMRHAFLQHGSLLVGPRHEGLVDLLRDTRRDPALAAAMRQRLRRETITLGEILGSTPDFATLAEALVAGFASELDLEPRPAVSAMAPPAT